MRTDSSSAPPARFTIPLASAISRRANGITKYPEWTCLADHFGPMIGHRITARATALRP
jgi:hypothetical protein